jgi:hypothetical protein
MSYISASRMPHAYAEQPAQDGGIGARVRREIGAARAAIGKISLRSWLLGGLGVGTAGAALYGTLRVANAPGRGRRVPRKRPA